MLGLHLLLDEPHAAGQRHGFIDGTGRPAVEQPRAQLPFLGPGQRDHLLRLVGAVLDERQGLQHRVVHPGGDVGPFLRADPGLALHHQVPRDAQPPRAEQHHDRGDQQRHPGQRLQQRDVLVRGLQRADAAAEQDRRDGEPQDQPGPPGARGQAQQWLDLTADCGLLVLRGVPPDQHQAGPGDGQRPDQRAQPSGVQHRGQDADHDQHGPEAEDERDATPVGHRLTSNAALGSGHRDQQPGEYVGGRDEAAGQHRGHDQDDPHRGDVAADPVGDGGRDPTDQAVLPGAAQRAAAPAGPPPPGAVPPGVPGGLRILGPVRWHAGTARGAGIVPGRPQPAGSSTSPSSRLTRAPGYPGNP